MDLTSPLSVKKTDLCVALLKRQPMKAALTSQMFPSLRYSFTGHWSLPYIQTEDSKESEKEHNYHRSPRDQLADLGGREHRHLDKNVCVTIGQHVPGM
ncbi:unnamed protein product [Soboliphyme baturini]|uniref:Uncharacterized protein n=1 Tax=Soboliphyme baturini TaxID=241478 RepID=A0A183J5K5_9BILA|nr:unnamed protein product [Soboliphyme baturini]